MSWLYVMMVMAEMMMWYDGDCSLMYHGPRTQKRIRLIMNVPKRYGCHSGGHSAHLELRRKYPDSHVSHPSLVYPTWHCTSSASHSPAAIAATLASSAGTFSPGHDTSGKHCRMDTGSSIGSSACTT